MLLPWLPTLISTLRASGAELAPLLIREAGRIFPGRLPALDAGVPPWRAEPQREAAQRETTQAAPSASAGRGATLLAAHPATCDALASLLGCEGTWEAAAPGPAGAALVGHYPDTALALEALLAGH